MSYLLRPSFLSQTTSDISSLNATSADFYRYVTNPKISTPGGFSGNMVDVRDVALAHVLAIETEKAGGERIIVSNGPFTWESFRESPFARFSLGVIIEYVL